jgi:hypothetical protein
MAKNYLGTIARSWSLRTDAERSAWATWATNNPVTDKLGQKQVLSGNAAYMKLNGRLLLCDLAAIVLPPIAYAPPALTTATITADIGSVPFTVAFTATPLAAGNRLWVRAAVTQDASQGYVKNKLKFMGVSGAAQISPSNDPLLPAVYNRNWDDALAFRFGSLIVGQLVTMYISVFSGTTGLLSTPLVATATVVNTP